MKIFSRHDSGNRKKWQEIRGVFLALAALLAFAACNGKKSESIVAGEPAARPAAAARARVAPCRSTPRRKIPRASSA